MRPQSPLGYLSGTDWPDLERGRFIRASGQRGGAGRPPPAANGTAAALASAWAACLVSTPA